ncbi:MAG: SDR family NAD(P)-dependent oxidoreductase [Candidatus Eisenbacteria bacterium]
MSLRFQHAIVVGASSGIGAEIARQLAADGASVAIVGRRVTELEAVAAGIRSAGKGKVLVAPHDVTQYDSAPPLFEKLVADLGGLDLVVYAAGNIFVPAESEYDFAKDRAMIEVQVIGAMAWTHLAAAHFEAQRSGTIVGLSSIAGERGRRTMPGYTTAKAALSAWLEALRNRVSRYGVNVVTVKLGFVDTIMTAKLTKKPMMISAQKAADSILATARRGGSPSAFIPGQWGLVGMIIRSIPSAIFRRLDL